MKIQSYNEILIKTVREKLPQEITPATFLMDILSIGKEAAYRRLRGEVPLTLEEAARIAKALNISIDTILETSSKKLSSYRLSLAEFENPEEADYRILEEYVDLIRSAVDDSSSRLSLSANMFPQQVYLQYENLTRFFLFKKAYHDTGKQVKTYHRIQIPQRMQQIFRNSFEAHRYFRNIHFVFDKHILHYLVRDISYFYGIGLIRKPDVDLIYRDMVEMIAYLENIAMMGKYDNGAQVNLYISNINFDKNCYNIKIWDQYISIIEAYILNGLASTDKSDYDRMEEWILSRSRFSTMISLCGEPQRIVFFNGLRSLLEAFKI